MFNLRSERNDPIAILRNASPALGDVMDSDLDSLSNDEILHLASTIRTAVHGTGSNWVRDEPNSSPYKTSPLVNYQGPQFGGRWRNDFPGGGDQHINDDGDKAKSLRGNAMDGDFDEKGRNDRLDDLLQEKGEPYTVRFILNDGERGTDELAKEVFGDDAKTDGRSIYVTVNGFEAAQEAQRNVPGSIIETKGEGK